MKTTILLLALVACVSYTTALYNQCNNGKEFDNLEEMVKISQGCKKTYCKLKKGTKIDIEMKFRADEEIKSIKNTVSAEIAGIPFPFIGTDGEDACPNIFEEDGTTKAACPLKGGKNYVYRNAINVLQIYPRVKVIVHWGLTTPKGDVMCFEVPARITNS